MIITPWRVLEGLVTVLFGNYLFCLRVCELVRYVCLGGGLGVFEECLFANGMEVCFLF